MTASRIRLGVNIDHVATIRNARGGGHPDPARAAALAEASGADGITLHLREDRRHIRDDDLKAIRDAVSLPINMEIAATDEMVGIATRFRPETVMFVPEKRQELTTEGGLEVVGGSNAMRDRITRLRELGCKVSLFIAADPARTEAAAKLGADIVEFHTGPYVDACHEGDGKRAARELAAIQEQATHAAALGLEPQAGHGLTYDTVEPVAAIPQLTELNIGHFLMGEAIFAGLGPAIEMMRERMDAARA